MCIRVLHEFSAVFISVWLYAKKHESSSFSVEKLGKGDANAFFEIPLFLSQAGRYISQMIKGVEGGVKVMSVWLRVVKSLRGVTSENRQRSQRQKRRKLPTVERADEPGGSKVAAISYLTLLVTTGRPRKVWKEARIECIAVIERQLSECLHTTLEWGPSVSSPLNCPLLLVEVFFTVCAPKLCGRVTLACVATIATSTRIQRYFLVILFETNLW